MHVPVICSMKDVIKFEDNQLIALPKVTASPYVSIVQFSIKQDLMSVVEVLLLRSIPIYWRQPGIVDVKVLKAHLKSQILVITSWENEELANIGDNSADWVRFDRLWSEYINTDQVRVKELIKEQFELIE